MTAWLKRTWFPVSLVGIVLLLVPGFFLFGTNLFGYEGDLKLIDIEDNDEAEVTVSAPLIQRYKQNLAAYQSGIQSYCSRRGITFLFTSNQVPFDRLVLTYLRQRGLVK